MDLQNTHIINMYTYSLTYIYMLYFYICIFFIYCFFIYIVEDPRSLCVALSSNPVSMSGLCSTEKDQVFEDTEWGNCK